MARSNKENIGHVLSVQSPSKTLSKIRSPKGAIPTKQDNNNNDQFLKEDKGPYEELFSTESYVRPVIEQIKLWTQILTEWDRWQDGRLQYLIYCEGIPSSLRTKIWNKFLNVDKLKKLYPVSFYKSLIEQEADPQNCIQIKLDIPRTFSTHILFREGNGKGQLLNILTAYSIFNPEVGYCQGMNFVCACLLINNLSEEEAFWMLVGIMENFQENYYSNMIGILGSSETFNQFLKLYNPTIHNHLEKLQSVNVIFISQWFLCLFSNLNHWQTVLRLWDVIFFEGKYSLLKISLAIIQCCEKQILECTQFSELGPFLINIPKEIIHPKHLLPVIFTIDIYDLLKKINPNQPPAVPIEKSICSETSSLISQIRQFWAQFNRTPQKIISNKLSERRYLFFSKKL